MAIPAALCSRQSNRLCAVRCATCDHQRAREQRTHAIGCLPERGGCAMLIAQHNVVRKPSHHIDAFGDDCRVGASKNAVVRIHQVRFLGFATPECGTLSAQGIVLVKQIGERSTPMRSVMVLCFLPGRGSRSAHACPEPHVRVGLRLVQRLRRVSRGDSATCACLSTVLSITRVSRSRRSRRCAAALVAQSIDKETGHRDVTLRLARHATPVPCGSKASEADVGSLPGRACPGADQAGKRCLGGRAPGSLPSPLPHNPPDA